LEFKEGFAGRPEEGGLLREKAFFGFDSKLTSPLLMLRSRGNSKLSDTAEVKYTPGTLHRLEASKRVRELREVEARRQAQI
jgi:hypothetical protein